MSGEIDSDLEDLLREIAEAEEEVGQITDKPSDSGDEPEESDTHSDSDADTDSTSDDGLNRSEGISTTEETEPNECDSLIVDNTIDAVIDEIDERSRHIQDKLLELVDRHCESANMMFDEAEVDRKKIDMIMGILLPKIQNDNYKSADIQSLASLMQTKSDISRNRSSMMDSVSRLFAALKNNDRLGGQASGDENLTNDEVEKLLNKRD